MYKVWKKDKEMKNGYKLQAYPIKLENNDFPSGQDKAEALVNLQKIVYHQISIHRLPTEKGRRTKRRIQGRNSKPLSLLEFPITI